MKRDKTTFPADGSAYGRAPQQPDKHLTEVGPGTPMGELLRRYWQPVAVSEAVKDLPLKVRILGEDLVLFRAGNGKCGLFYPRCMHRGTSLYYGIIEQQGLRCCYHGWLYDVEGNCLEMPCEPGGGIRREICRQPWYPVQERYGLVFAYMGPPDRKPVLPRYDNLEQVEEGYELWAHVGALGATFDFSLPVAPYSWLHMNDNVLDPYHVYVLHSTLTGPQFASEFALAPKVEFFKTEHGICYSAVRELDDGRSVARISSWLMPNIMSVPDIYLQEGKSGMVAWNVAVDNTHFTQAMVSKMEKGRKFEELRFNGKRWHEMTETERQRRPGDYEAQASQGPVSLHSEEHLVTSDKGINMQRRMLKQQMKIVRQGGDPAGVVFHEAQATVNIRSGNYYHTVKQD
jgi:phenylpropionate dioxygenase-like ring-hydroxylating dioxygenase large terminal subunit